MENKYRIVVDTLGSDKGPEAILSGIKKVLEEQSEVDFTIVGDEELIKNYGLPLERVKIINAKETVTNYDNPVQAFYKADKVSIFLALQEVANDDNSLGMITAGSTGALMVGTIKYLLDENRTRPALAAILPTTEKDKFTCLVDTGASVDCGPLQLVEFAHLGSNFMKKLYKIDSPRVGLLSNGAEPTKGNKLVKETHKLLAEDKSINFIGNVEGSKALNYQCDVLVSEGFAGNQVLKVTEGIAKNLITELIKFGKMSGNDEVCMQAAGHILKKYDFESNGAGIMLGAKKTVLKCRGSSGDKAIVNACRILINLHSNKTMYE